LADDIERDRLAVCRGCELLPIFRLIREGSSDPSAISVSVAGARQWTTVGCTFPLNRGFDGLAQIAGGVTDGHASAGLLR
jgi:hypothetical protein